MKIEITAGGIFNGAGEEIAIGTVLDVKKEPEGWAGRYRVIGKEEGELKTGESSGEEETFDPDKATVAQLKEFLEANGIGYDDSAKKADLVELARKA